MADCPQRAKPSSGVATRCRNLGRPRRSLGDVANEVDAHTWERDDVGEAMRSIAGQARLAVVGMVLLLLLQVAAAASAVGRSRPTGPPRNVAVSPDLPQAYQQPSIARDPTRRGHLAIAYQERAELKNCFIALSSDNGRTWQTRALFGPDGEFEMPPPPPPGTSAFRRCVNPVVAFDAKGNL